MKSINNNNYVYKDPKDIQIEKLEKIKMELVQRVQELSGDNEIEKIKKQNELYRTKLNNLLNKNSSQNDDKDKFYSDKLLKEKNQLQNELDKIKQEMETLKQQLQEYEIMKKERKSMTENVLVNQKVVFLTEEIKKLKDDIENSEKVKGLAEENSNLKQVISKMKQNTQKQNSMQIEKLLNDRRRNISEIIKKQKKIDRLLEFISKNKLMPKLLAY